MKDFFVHTRIIFHIRMAKTNQEYLFIYLFFMSTYIIRFQMIYNEKDIIFRSRNF